MELFLECGVEPDEMADLRDRLKTAVATEEIKALVNKHLSGTPWIADSVEVSYHFKLLDHALLCGTCFNESSFVDTSRCKRGWASHL